MIVAGDHANNDMAGDDEDSWKSILEEEGYEVMPVLKGLGEYPGIQRIFVRHVAEAIGS
jgi:sirohydrochlorin cobaltochelatase